jgi:hypothetical protein
MGADEGIGRADAHSVRCSRAYGNRITQPQTEQKIDMSLAELATLTEVKHCESSIVYS